MMSAFPHRTPWRGLAWCKKSGEGRGHVSSSRLLYENRSMTAARSSQPSAVQIWVKSATHFWLGASAAILRHAQEAIKDIASDASS